MKVKAGAARIFREPDHTMARVGVNPFCRRVLRSGRGRRGRLGSRADNRADIGRQQHSRNEKQCNRQTIGNVIHVHPPIVRPVFRPLSPQRRRRTRRQRRERKERGEEEKRRRGKEHRPPASTFFPSLRCLRVLRRLCGEAISNVADRSIPKAYLHLLVPSRKAQSASTLRAKVSERMMRSRGRSVPWKI